MGVGADELADLVDEEVGAESLPLGGQATPDVIGEISMDTAYSLRYLVRMLVGEPPPAPVISAYAAATLTSSRTPSRPAPSPDRKSVGRFV